MPTKDKEKLKAARARAEAKRKWDRAYVYSVVIYPDELEKVNPEWRDDIKSYYSEIGVVAILSPLHTKDVKDDGTAAKPHYLLGLRYNDKMSVKQVEEEMSYFTKISWGRLIGIARNPKKWFGTGKGQGDALSRLLKYMIHWGYFDKPQYNANDFVTLSGGDAFNYINFAPEERNRLKANIIRIVQCNSICSLIDLDTILRTMPFERHIYNNMAISSVVNDYIKEQARKLEQDKLVSLQTQELQLLTMLVEHIVPSAQASENPKQLNQQIDTPDLHNVKK